MPVLICEGTPGQRGSVGCFLRFRPFVVAVCVRWNRGRVKVKRPQRSEAYDLDVGEDRRLVGVPRRAPPAENIAWGYRSGAEVVSAWMNSPAHRANIVNCEARSVGALYAANGTPSFTQDFGSR